MTVREAVLMMSGGGVADLSPDSDRTTTVRASIGTEEEINRRDRAQGHREGGGELGEAGEVGEERGGGGEEEGEGEEGEEGKRGVSDTGMMVQRVEE